MKTSPLLLALLPGLVLAADLPPDKGNTIPESATRPVVVKVEARNAKSELPKADLPEGYTLSVAAASPLVLHPIMGCLDDKGRLFIGDGTGVNWNKAQLEANPPNRVLMLEDTDNDGAFDKSTVFADKMTFPQGAAWLDGSLYVCSPPGLWKLTDTNNDGVADQREMIVNGFDYTGNAADVHGPFLHPNGRLYWCHGRKGHKATDRDGKVVHEGLACGIWSCKPDGRDLQWHALGCGDNPVEVDFTPDGDVIGVQNLYYTNPRGDTLVHWLYGGVYERSDQLKAIEGLPRTLEHMPVMYNFGHVAVSGSCFWKSYGSAHAAVGDDGHQDQAKPGDVRADKSVLAPLQFMVTHFNTQRVVRMELTPDGATYKATENEFLKLHSPDIHFTDVMEDPRDGSLLVVDTGGWFRIGCPSSLMAKPDIAGAIYRVKAAPSNHEHLVHENRWQGHAPQMHPMPTTMDQVSLFKGGAPSVANMLAMLQSSDAFEQRRGCDLLGLYSTNYELASSQAIFEAFRNLLAAPLDTALEHAAINAYFHCGYDLANSAASPLQMRRILKAQSNHRGGYDKGPDFHATKVAWLYLDDKDPELAATALDVFIGDPSADKWIKDVLPWLEKPGVSTAQLNVLKKMSALHLAKPEAQKLVTQMLGHQSSSVRSAALEVLSSQSAASSSNEWFPALDAMLASRTGVSPVASASGILPDAAGRMPATLETSRMPVLLDAIKKLKTDHFDAKLQAIANDAKQPQSLRLKALDAMSTRKITGETFTMVLEVLTKPESSAAAKIQAADMMAHSGHTAEERVQLAKAFATVGPVELKSLLALIKPCKEEGILRAMATELAKNPALISQQESIYRTALADRPTDIFEQIIHPAYARAYDAIDAKKRTLGPLSDKVIARGDPSAGKAVFESGKGTCIACHQIGDKGRSIGPNLSHIGGIRTERDLLESILFPSNTLARDYEAHIIETSAGETVLGVIRSHTAEGLLVVDVAGVEHNVPQTTMVSDTTLTTSLMPMGLDATLPEQDLLNLVAYLRSLK